MEKYPKFKEAPEEKTSETEPKLEIIESAEETQEAEGPTYSPEFEKKLLQALREKRVLKSEELPRLTPEEIKDKKWSTPSEKYAEWRVAQEEIRKLVDETIAGAEKFPKLKNDKEKKAA